MISFVCLEAKHNILMSICFKVQLMVYAMQCKSNVGPKCVHCPRTFHTECIGQKHRLISKGTNYKVQILGGHRERNRHQRIKIQ